MIKCLLEKTKFFYLFLSILFIALILPANLSFAKDNAPSPGDAILGEWLTQLKDSKVIIYKQGNKYYGKLSWLKEPNRDGKPKLDHKNPDKAKQSNPIMGMNLLRDFSFIKDNKWEGGQVYSPRDGKEYNCILTLKNEKTLEVRGYIGFSFIGKTEVWTK